MVETGTIFNAIKSIIFIFFKIEVEKFYIMIYNYISYK